MAEGQLSPVTRGEALSSLRRERLDLLVVGGGITGTGIALDAAARGLRVGLIEKDDLASGTSSRSSKMIHGGLRYLEQLRFGLVREALQERELLATEIAPHLVRPVPFLLPIRYWWERVYLGLGLMLYDRLAGKSIFPRARHLSRLQTERIAPALGGNAHRGGIQFWDGQEDDARYVVAVARTAACHGAKIATRVRADTLIRENERVIGITACDEETGEHFPVFSRHVVTATGAWSGQLAEGRSPAFPRVRPSKGVHFLLAGSALDMVTGLIARTPTGLLFVIPWEGYWLVGDTDADWDGDPTMVAATSDEVQTLLGRLNSQFSKQLAAEDVLAVYAGVRPLAATRSDGDPRSVSRSHVIVPRAAGLTEIFGGKYTTYRRMAAELVDRVLPDLGCTHTPPSPTAALPLLGAAGLDDLRAKRYEFASEFNLDTGDVDQFLVRHGGLMPELLELMRECPALWQPLQSYRGYRMAEIVHACRMEGALHLEDVMERRTRLGLWASGRIEQAVEEVANLMAIELGWTNGRLQSEKQGYLLRWALMQRSIAPSHP